MVTFVWRHCQLSPAPRRSVRPAVDLLSISHEDSRIHLPVLSLLVDATRTPSVDRAIFGSRPFVTDVVDYVCRNLTNIVDVV
jgi:hypothetical protein